MALPRTRRPVIGFISTWPIYQGMTIDRYAHSLIQGIGAAASAGGCDLLLGCGFSTPDKSATDLSFWPVPGPGVDFVPVGPWNTDGLIIVPDDLTPEQSQYVGDLLASGFPVIFTTPEGPGPVVAVDNTHGIRQAFSHLRQHGHQQIAFVAGNRGEGGDSAERLRAFRDCLSEAGLPEDERLIAYGGHRHEGGAAAMQQILERGAPFTALMASNDLSCLGAMKRLTETGRRIPQDVAVVGFDDILDARSLSPALTTVRHPTFQLGYQAVVTLIEHITGQRPSGTRVVITPQLIVRQSCGCGQAGDYPAPAAGPAPHNLADLAHAMAEATWIEARHSPRATLEEQCTRWLTSLLSSLEQQAPELSLAETQRVLAWAAERGEDGQLWQSGAACVAQHLDALLRLTPTTSRAFAAGLLDRLRLQIGDEIQRQTARAMLAHMELTAQLGQLTAELLSALNVADSAAILARHLPQVGIQNALVALYQGRDDDPVAQGTVLIGAGLPAPVSGRQFEPRQFPVRDIYPPGSPLHLTILPLAIDADTSGFVAFSAPNPELCAAIVHNLVAALRTSRLYSAAIDGRRLAEEASQLKSRFLSMVSHELRTPLSLIVGLSDIVLREQGQQAQLAADARQDLEQINLSAQHLGRLLSDVLDLASSEAGTLRIVGQPLDLAEVLRLAAATGEQLVHAKGLSWRASLPEAGPWVFGDPTRLRQVVLNLISNAAKFSDQGEVTLTLETQPGWVTVAVTDSGIGIAPSEQELVFHEFQRSQRSIREGYGGLGLGLAVCKQLIQQHGGSIGVQSPAADGRGARVFFTLPLMAEAPTLTATTTGPSVPVVVLLAGDAEAGQRVRHYLEGRGFEVHAYAPAQDPHWINETGALKPAAVVMDDGLASAQGWEIMAALKRPAATAPVPILVYALSPTQNQGEVLELNYLPKPLRLEQLTQELERYQLGSQPLVLIVDDDPDLLAVHSRTVQEAGYRVTVAHNGREALAAVQQARPDLILLDLVMPALDGFQVLEHLRQQEATRSIPVIVVTGQTLTEDDTERLNRGVAAILSKGIFTAGETLGRIEAALARRSGASSTAQRFTARATSFMQTHLAEPLTRDDIARHVAISGNYLTECFRQVLGITPMAYLTRCRMQRAQRLLTHTDLSITEIAAETGFSELSHFTHTFKREMGVSPNAYRRGQPPKTGVPRPA
jgi:signal transduction histidine kinase/DNA-binding LacI/PurR family transcriptional regulator/CheY-like chemotaxis protein